MDGSRKFRQGVMCVCWGGGHLTTILVINVFTEGRMDHRGKQLNPVGPLASRSGSVPENLRKHIATCDFPGGGVRTLFLPLYPRMRQICMHRLA